MLGVTGVVSGVVLMLVDIQMDFVFLEVAPIIEVNSPQVLG